MTQGGFNMDGETLKFLMECVCDGLNGDCIGSFESIAEALKEIAMQDYFYDGNVQIVCNKMMNSTR